MGKDAREPSDASLGDLLAPHVDALAEAAAVREQLSDPPPPTLRRLDEGELMTLIFAHLDPENPRVCEGIDFERILVVADDAPSEPVRAEPPAPASPTPPQPSPAPPVRPQLRPQDWIGASWVDVVRPVDAALLDRPELGDAQRELLRRARRSPHLSTLVLRHLPRRAALDHLDLFMDLCRTRRDRYCRVIPGKGIDSQREPVLKRAVLGWCGTTGSAQIRGWAPEIDAHGEWGSLVLELRRAA